MKYCRLQINKILVYIAILTKLILFFIAYRNMRPSSIIIMSIATIPIVFLLSHVSSSPQGWSYPGLWYYSTLPSFYNYRRQVSPPPTPISDPSNAPHPVKNQQQPSHRDKPSPKKIHTSAIRDRCEPKNWGNLVGKCRMSCDTYGGVCTETLITTDCGCTGELIVK